MATLRTVWAVYRLYDEFGQALYIGQSLDPMRRLFLHAKWKPWWSEVRSVALDIYYDEWSARLRESVRILRERPRYSEQRVIDHDEPTPIASYGPVSISDMSKVRAAYYEHRTCVCRCVRCDQEFEAHSNGARFCRSCSNDPVRLRELRERSSNAKPTVAV